MTWSAVAGGAVSVVGSYLSGSESSDAAEKSAEIQAEASEYAADIQNEQFKQLMARETENQRKAELRLQPYSDLGYNALTALQYGMGLGDPNYAPKTRQFFDEQQFTSNINNLIANKPVNPNTRADWKTLTTAQQNELTDKYNTDLSAWTYADALRNAKVSPWDMYEKAVKDKKESLLGIDKVFSNRYGGTFDSGQGQALGGMGGYGQLVKKFTKEDFEADPGYEFRRNEGMRNIQASAAARGGLQSGAALKALNRYGQDVASAEYQNAYNRYGLDQANAYNRLAAVLGTGQVGTQQIINQGNMATGNINQAGQANAAAQANALMQGADARASGYMGAAAAKSQMYGNIANNLGYMSYNAFSK